MTTERPPLFTRRCPRCKSPTLRLSLCGICDALEHGMTDEQVRTAIEILTPMPKREPRRVWGPDR